MDIYLITNDAFAPVPCVMTVEQFNAQCQENEWGECEIAQAGTKIESYDHLYNLVQHSFYAEELKSAYRKLTGAK